MTTYLFLYFLIGVVAFIVVNRFVLDEHKDTQEDMAIISIGSLLFWPAVIFGFASFHAAKFIRNYKR